MAGNFVDRRMYSVFIRSCRQLKEESYDIFYAAENQKCLEENVKQMQKLSEQIEQSNDLIKKEKLLDDVLASSEKFDACKISKGLTVAGFSIHGYEFHFKRKIF